MIYMLLLKNDHKRFGFHGEDTFSFFEILLILVSHLYIVKILYHISSQSLCNYSKNNLKNKEIVL